MVLAICHSSQQNIHWHMRKSYINFKSRHKVAQDILLHNDLILIEMTPCSVFQDVLHHLLVHFTSGHSNTFGDQPKSDFVWESGKDNLNMDTVLCTIGK